LRATIGFNNRRRRTRKKTETSERPTAEKTQKEDQVCQRRREKVENQEFFTKSWKKRMPEVRFNPRVLGFRVASNMVYVGMQELWIPWGFHGQKRRNCWKIEKRPPEEHHQTLKSAQFNRMDDSCINQRSK